MSHASILAVATASAATSAAQGAAGPAHVVLRVRNHPTVAGRIGAG